MRPPAGNLANRLEPSFAPTPPLGPPGARPVRVTNGVSLVGLGVGGGPGRWGGGGRLRAAGGDVVRPRPGGGLGGGGHGEEGRGHRRATDPLRGVPRRALRDAGRRRATRGACDTRHCKAAPPQPTQPTAMTWKAHPLWRFLFLRGGGVDHPLPEEKSAQNTVNIWKPKKKSKQIGNHFVFS